MAVRQKIENLRRKLEAFCVSVKYSSANNPLLHLEASLAKSMSVAVGLLEDAVLMKKKKSAVNDCALLIRRWL